MGTHLFGSPCSYKVPTTNHHNKGCRAKSKSSFHSIRIIEFCGRQEIPLRGHRDIGAFSLNETDCNGGVFKAALTLSVRIFYTDLKQNLRRWNMFWWIKVVQLAVSVVFSLIFAYQNWDNFVPAVPRQYYTVAQICPYSSILSLNR